MHPVSRYNHIYNPHTGYLSTSEKTKSSTYETFAKGITDSICPIADIGTLICPKSIQTAKSLSQYHTTKTHILTSIQDIALYTKECKNILVKSQISHKVTGDTSNKCHFSPKYLKLLTYNQLEMLTNHLNF